MLLKMTLDDDCGGLTSEFDNDQVCEGLSRLAQNECKAETTSCTLSDSILCGCGLPEGEKVAFHDPKNTIMSPGVTALVKSRRACIQDVPETGWPPAELAGGVNRLNTPATEVERRGSGIGGGLQGKSKLRVTPIVDELLPRKIQVH